MNELTRWKVTAASLRMDVDNQSIIINGLDAAIGRQQVTIGDLQTELAAKDREIIRLRGMVGRGGKLVERLRDMLAGAE